MGYFGGLGQIWLSYLYRNSPLEWRKSERMRIKIFCRPQWFREFRKQKFSSTTSTSFFMSKKQVLISNSLSRHVKCKLSDFSLPPEGYFWQVLRKNCFSLTTLVYVTSPLLFIHFPFSEMSSLYTPLSLPYLHMNLSFQGSAQISSSPQRPPWNFNSQQSSFVFLWHPLVVYTFSLLPLSFTLPSFSNYILLVG